MEIEKIVERFIMEEILLSKDAIAIDYNQSLVLTGIIDSLGLLRLITFIEEQFGIAVADDEVAVENFDSIDLIADYVTKRK